VLAIRFSTERNTHTHTQTSRGRKMEEKKKTQQRHKQRHKYKGRIQRACKRRNRNNNNNNNTLKFQTWTNKNAEEKLLHSPNAFLVQERMREATSKQFSRHCAILNHFDFLKLLHCTSRSLLLLFSSFSSASSLSFLSLKMPQVFPAANCSEIGQPGSYSTLGLSHAAALLVMNSLMARVLIS
jgi:hypothetical protein